MLSVSISFLSLTLVYFLVGMYRPGWALFGMKNPSRIWVIVITALGLMVGLTLYGEGLKQKQVMATEKVSEPPAKADTEAAPAETIAEPPAKAKINTEAKVVEKMSEPLVKTNTEATPATKAKP